MPLFVSVNNIVLLEVRFEYQLRETNMWCIEYAYSQVVTFPPSDAT
jgi:hypothetical protein